MSSRVFGVLSEKIVVCLFLMGDSVQSVSNMSIVGG